MGAKLRRYGMDFRDDSASNSVSYWLAAPRQNDRARLVFY